MKTIVHMTGQQMAAAIMNDPQFKMPKYPRVSEGFGFIYINGDRLLVNGGPEKQLFRGKSIHNILPYVVKQCDGTKSIEEILESKEYSSENIFQVLSLLYARGLLQEGFSSEGVKRHPLYSFFDRLVDGTRINANVDAAIEKVKNTKIYIDYNSLESRRIADKFIEYLSPYGIDIDVSIHPKSKNHTKSLVIGICTDEAEISDWKEKTRSYYQEGIPFLFLWFRGEKLIVGPYVDKWETICFECFTDQLERLKLPTVKKETSRHQYSLGFSIALPTITHIVSEICIMELTQNQVEVIDLNILNKEKYLFTLSSNCATCRSTCGEDGDHKGEKFNVISQYESMVEFPSRKYLNLRAHQNHYKAKNLNLTQEFKTYFNSPSIPINSLTKNSSDLSLSKLIQIMNYTTGIKENLPHKVKRWCPTGGNLGSVNLYYFNRNINGLDNKIYYYHPMHNELQVLTNDLKHHQVEGIVLEQNQNVLGYIILTGVIKKLATKYRQLSFRLANLDAGVAMAQCQVAAQKINWNITRLDSFNEDTINSLLGLYDIGEIVTMVLEIREGNNYE